MLALFEHSYFGRQLIPIHHFHDTHEFIDIYYTPFMFSVFQPEKEFSLLSYFLPFPIPVDLLNFYFCYILSEYAALKGEQNTDL